MTLDDETLEALGFGDQIDALVWSGWSERLIAADAARVNDYRQTLRGKQRRVEAQARYLRTEQGKAAQRRYLVTKGYATMRAYRATEAGRAAKARANARYRAKAKAST